MKKEVVITEHKEEVKLPNTLFFNMYAMKCLLAFAVDNNLGVTHYVVYLEGEDLFEVSFAGIHPEEGKPVWARQFKVPEDKIIKTVKSAFRMLHFYEHKALAKRAN